MKKALLFAVTAIVLAACADTRSHVNKDATSWEKVQYEQQDAKQPVNQ